MQKLSKRNTYTPPDASLVRSPVTATLNRDGSLSERGLKTFDNSVEGNQPQHTEGQDKVSVIVYVLNKDGSPLMPTKPRKAKHLLREGAARVIQRAPFTIQMTRETPRDRQDITLGIDPGAKYIGFSATTKDKELISGTVILDQMQKKRLEQKRNYRRNRRSRLWHRKPRFLNRAKPEGWLPPSIERRYQAHLKLIELIKKILPITKTTIEVAQFNIQKIRDPEIEGKEYQQGDQYGYSNTKAYILARENYTCQLCNKSVIGKGSQLHHIIPRSKGGTDLPNNLALLHKKCHDKLHKQGLQRKLKKPKQYREAIFMSIISKRFKESVHCRVTYGHKTHTDRINLNLPKTHYNDAFIIAGGTTQTRATPKEVKQTKRNNRSIQKNRKGFAPAIRRQKYPIQPNDTVIYNNKPYISKGTHCKGLRVILSMLPKPKSINIRDLVLLTYSPGLQFLPQQS